MNRQPTAGIVRGSANHGFTLIETLVALIIAAVASAVILAHLRSLMQRSEKEHAHQLAALQLLNDSVRIANGGMVNALPPRMEQGHLVIDPANGELGFPQVRVHNFSALGEPLPPIEFAYTPFQSFGLARDRYAIHAIAPGIKAPKDAVTAGIPDNVAAAAHPTAAESSAPAKPD